MISGHSLFGDRTASLGASKVCQQPEKQPQAPKRIGLAISSGGARGLAHVGVIQVLEENNIQIDAVAGSSMGAYVGALWCAGYRGPQLGALAAEIHDRRAIRGLTDPAFPPTKGLFKGKRVKQHLRRSIGDIKFKRLERPLYVIAADVDTSERVVFHKGRVIDAVHASCAMPGMIVPVKYQGRRLMDGGVVDPIPVTVLTKYAKVDYTIAVTTIPTLEEIDHCEISRPNEETPGFWKRALHTLTDPVNLLAKGNVIHTINRALKASQVRMAQASCNRADVVIRPISCTGSWHHYHEYKHFINIGRRAAERALPELNALMQSQEKSTAPLHHETSSEKLVGARVE